MTALLVANEASRVATGDHSKIAGNLARKKIYQDKIP